MQNRTAIINRAEFDTVRSTLEYELEQTRLELYMAYDDLDAADSVERAERVKIEITRLTRERRDLDIKLDVFDRLANALVDDV